MAIIELDKEDIKDILDANYHSTYEGDHGIDEELLIKLQKLFKEMYGYEYNDRWS